MNNTYILLRNNIESSALSLSDIKQIGLLPTDLLWVECQSVSWRHPYEIPELKNLVMETIPMEKKVSDEGPVEKFAPPVQEITASNTKKNLVYVKLPKKDDPVIQNNDAAKVKKEDAPVMKKEADIKYPVNTATKTNYLPINDVLLDSYIPEPYVRQPAQKERKDLMESLLSMPRKKVALYGGLLVAGALMMLVIRGTGGNNKEFGKPVSQQTEIINTTLAEEPSTEPADTMTTPESYDQQTAPAEEITVAPVAEQKVIPPAKPTVPAKKVEPMQEKKETMVLKNEPPADNPAPAASIKEERTTPAANIASQIQVKTNEYNVAAFGGIRNLQLTLHNNSTYFLDKVSVEVRYLNPEGALVQTGTIDFKFIRPGDASTIAVKKSSRGVKVSYKILMIESKELATNNAGNNNYSKN